MANKCLLKAKEPIGESADMIESALEFIVAKYEL